MFNKLIVSEICNVQAKHTVGLDSFNKGSCFTIASPPLSALLSPSSRFGSLIEVHLVPGRKVGYMKYADKQVRLSS